MKTREILVSPEWLLTLWSALLPEERVACGDASIGNRPSLTLDQLCPVLPASADGFQYRASNAELHKLIFIGDISMEDFGNMIQESKETT